MRKLRRILLVVALVLVVLLVGLFVGVRFFFPVEKAKDFALGKAREALGRDVTIEEVSLSFRGGIGLRLDGLVVANPAGFGGDPLLTTDDVDLKVALWPLIRGSVRGERLVINGPHVVAVKKADGSDNFTFEPAQTAAPVGATETGTPTESVDIAIDRIEIRDGRVTYRDEALGQGLHIEGLRLDSKLVNENLDVLRVTGSLATDTLRVQAASPLPVLSPRAEFDLAYDQAARTGTLNSLTLEAAGIPLQASGSFAGQGDQLTARAKITAEAIDADQLLALAPPEALAPLEGTRIAGRLALDCDVDFAAARAVPLTYEGKAVITEVVVRPPDAPTELKVARAEATFVPDHLELKILEASAGQDPLTGQVTVDDFLHPSVNGRLQGGIDLALAQPYLDPELQAELTGRAEFDARFSGPVEDPDALQVDGTADLKNMTLSAATLPEPIRQLDGRLEFDRTRVVVKNLTARTASSDISLQGTITDPLPYFLPPELQDRSKPIPQPKVTFAASSHRLDIDRLFPPASPGAAPAGTGAAAAGRPLAEFPDVAGTGTVAVDTLIYSKVPLTRLTANIELKDHTITCRDAQAHVYTGTVSGDAKIDLNDLAKPGYSGDYSAQQIEVDDFLQRFTRFGGLFYGKFDLTGDFAATGLLPQDIQGSLSLDSLADLKQGRVVTSGFAFDAMSGLASKMGQTLEQEQGLKNLTTAIRVESGRVILDGLKAGLGTLGDVTLSGSYGFAGDLQFGGSLLLTKDRTTKLLQSEGLVGKMAQLLGAGQTDRLALPLTVGGTLTKPSLKVDYSALTSAAAANAKGQADQKMQDERERLEREAKEKLGGKLKDLLKK